MKTLIIAALMVTATNSFAMTYEECAELVGNGAFNNQAGEVFGEKVAKAMIEGNEEVVEKGSDAAMKLAEAADAFCKFTVAE